MDALHPPIMSRGSNLVETAITRETTVTCGAATINETVEKVTVCD